MTNGLQNYNSIRSELYELDRLLARLNRHATPELRTYYERKRAGLVKQLKQFEAALEPFDPTERRLMRMRYVERLSWEAIALRLHYSKPQVYRIHHNVLEQLNAKSKD